MQVVIKYLACIAAKTQPLVKSICKAVPKSLFWTPNLVTGSEYAPFQKGDCSKNSQGLEPEPSRKQAF